MPQKILCVAEKPAIAKAVANHLAGGRVNTRSIQGNQYIKNYEFDFTFSQPWGNCSVTMTSVIGHLNGLDFEPDYRKWNSCSPEHLFDAHVIETVDDEKKAVADNITQQARYAKALFIWTDCDREGEHIGSEVRQAALKGNQRLQVKRARFSNTERAHVLAAALNPIDLDEHQVNAVAARIELDLRLGASFTRFQTLELQGMGESLTERVISYGSCQFPTLGFVVDRYFRVKNFVPEQFWSIKVIHRRDEIDVTFLWRRHRLFDRMAVIILFERCLSARTARVSKLQKKPTSKWRPLPLTTVELQKLGSMFLHMNSQQVMKVAEDLYTKGWISYPRTETDQFDKGIDLKKIIEKQVQSQAWGTYAQNLLNGAFRTPRAGRNNDQAHPPIHPVNFATPESLSLDGRRVYEFVVRRFLGCCSEDAKGEATTIEITYGDESFHANGLLVLQRNYLEVYTYDRWESSQQLPTFHLNENFEPTEANITDGETGPPGYLTEPELISLMDANGIGTDATMAEHISKIQERMYVEVRSRSGGTRTGAGQPTTRGARGGRGSRVGRGGDRDGAQATSGNSGILEFIPTTLGCALIEGYDNMGLATSLGKPFLRKEMEMKMKEICAGTKVKREVVQEVLEGYREVLVTAVRQVGVLRAGQDQFSEAQLLPRPSKNTDSVCAFLPTHKNFSTRMSNPNFPYPTSDSQAAQPLIYQPSALFPSDPSNPSAPFVLDGFIPQHPSHYYPHLFPQPTASLPASASGNPSLAHFYHAQIAAAQQWSQSQHEWQTASQHASPFPAADADADDSMSDAAEADGVQEQARLDAMQRQRNNDREVEAQAGDAYREQERVDAMQRQRNADREREARVGDLNRLWDDLSAHAPSMVARARRFGREVLRCESEGAVWAAWREGELAGMGAAWLDGRWRGLLLCRLM
ncbi:DNA topoisomerase [Lambiella insularis]|nr:DNA topoisomerase [Lambiella insularis]